MKDTIPTNKKITPTDLELIEAFQQGNERAFNDLVRRYQKQIFHIVLKMVRHYEEAQDVAQEVFVRAYNALPKFKRQSSFFSWLYRIALNLSINYAQRNKKHLLSSLDDYHYLSTDDSTTQFSESKELAKAIHKAVLKLPRRQQSVFAMRQYEHLPYKQIAEILEISIGAAKSNYFQAIQKLQKELREFV